METMSTISKKEIHLDTTSVEKSILESAEWSSIDQETYALYLEYLSRTPQKASEYSFLGAYIWKELFGLRYFANDELLFLSTNQNNVYWAPLGNWNRVDWDFYKFHILKPTFTYVPERLALLWKERYQDKVNVIEDRDSWDYIYSASDLATLGGRKYAKKKNHLSSFVRTTPEYAIEDITPANAERILTQYKIWAKTQESFTPLLHAEYLAICNLLHEWDSFESIQGIYIIVQDTIVAFAIGEALSSDTFVIQVEKALQDSRGLYQLINKAFAESILEQGYTYINRADDSGIAGLRKAKESYHPAEYLKKYTVTFL